MKITHMLPMDQWYDTAEYTHLDYPPLAAYLHYIMGFFVKMIDPISFNKGPYYKIMDPVPPMTKFAIRLIIIIVDLLTYYPAVIFVVLNYMAKARKSYKVITLLMYFNMPMYAVIEYRNTQINSPHMALLLLALYFTMEHKIEFATFLFSLSLAYKHYPAPYVLPIASYMIWIIYEKICSTKKSVSPFYFINLLEITSNSVFSLQMHNPSFYWNCHLGNSFPSIFINEKFEYVYCSI